MKRVGTGKNSSKKAGFCPSSRGKLFLASENRGSGVFFFSHCDCCSFPMDMCHRARYTMKTAHARSHYSGKERFHPVPFCSCRYEGGRKTGRGGHFHQSNRSRVGECVSVCSFAIAKPLDREDNKVGVSSTQHCDACWLV